MGQLGQLAGRTRPQAGSLLQLNSKRYTTGPYRGEKSRMTIPIDARTTTKADTEHVFFVTMAIAIAVMVIIGFATSFLRTNLASQLTSLWVQAHAAAFTCWILLFLTQTVLVAS